jgi:hypothetical protein
VRLADRHKWRVTADYDGAISIAHICGHEEEVTIGGEQDDGIELADLIDAAEVHSETCRA